MSLIKIKKSMCIYHHGYRVSDFFFFLEGVALEFKRKISIVLATISQYHFGRRNVARNISKMWLKEFI